MEKALTKARPNTAGKLCEILLNCFRVFVLSDAIPMLKWLDISGHIRYMKDTAKKLDKLVEDWLQEHKQRRMLGGLREEERDFMDVLLTILRDANVSCFDANIINKTTCLVSSRSIVKYFCQLLKLLCLSFDRIFSKSCHLIL